MEYTLRCRNIEVPIMASKDYLKYYFPSLGLIPKRFGDLFKELS